jgi:dihydroceramidase
MYIMEVNIRPKKRMYIESGIHKESLQQATNDQRDRTIIKEMWLMVGIGLSIFLGGFGIWALDNKYCSIIRRWRHEVGLPWGILLEGHGWW